MTDAELTAALLRESREIIRSLYEDAGSDDAPGDRTQPRLDETSEEIPVATSVEAAMRQLATAMQELLADADEPSRE